MSIQRYDPDPDDDGGVPMTRLSYGEYVLHADYANDLSAMQARAEKAEEERDEFRRQRDLLTASGRVYSESLIAAHSYTTFLEEMRAIAEARADRAEHFVRIIAGLRPGNIGESETGQLVRTAQATLQPITEKGTL